MLFRNCTLQLVMYFALIAPVLAQAPELIVEIDRDQVYEGESFIYQITLNHVENPSAPVLGGFDDFQVQSLGVRSLNSSQITIINGRRSEIIRRGQQYNYRLTPKHSGNLTIPAPTASVDGETLTGRQIQVQVVPPQKQDTVLLDHTVDRLTVYPTQAFTVTLVIAVKELPGTARKGDPLTVQRQPPAVSIPWLDDDSLVEGLEPQRSWKQILEPTMSRRGYGFQVNNIGSSSAFSFFDNRAAGFRPSPRQRLRDDSDGNATNYWEYEFHRTFVPQRPGQFDLGPVSLKGTFADRVQNGQLTGTDIYAVAENVSVNVRQVPMEGQPDSYIGAVGRLTADVQIAPLTVRVGDPMTLTVTVSGPGNVQDTRPPRIAEMPSVAESFRTYSATEETSGRTRNFIYSLRPLDTDITEFPSLPVSFFDVESEQYVTVQTDAIPITVNAAETLSPSDIMAVTQTGEAESVGPEKSVGGVFANVSSLSALRNEQIRPMRWFAAWGIILSGWFGLTIGLSRVRHQRSDPRLKRRRGAPAAAESGLAAAESQLQSGDVSGGVDSIHRSIAAVTAAWADIPEVGLTARDVADQLNRLGVDADLARRTERLLENCDAARFGASEKDASRLLEEAQELVPQIVQALRRCRSDLT